MICTHCSTYNDDSCLFCRKCGLPIHHHSSYSKKFIFNYIIAIFLIAGIGGLLTGSVLYASYPEMPEYLLVSVLGLMLLVFCIPINRIIKKFK